MTGITQEKTVSLGAERERLAEELDELVTKLSDADDPPAKLWSEAQDLDESGKAVSALAELHGEDETVTVRGLTAGEYARVEDHVGDADAGAGATRIAYAAAGLVDAPFLHADNMNLEDRMAAIADQPVGVRIWLETIVNDLATPDEGNWRPLADRLAAADTDS